MEASITYGISVTTVTFLPLVCLSSGDLTLTYTYTTRKGEISKQPAYHHKLVDASQKAQAPCFGGYKPGWNAAVRPKGEDEN